MPPKELDGSASVLAFFGAEIRYWRGQRNMSQEKLGDKLFCSPSLVAYIEQAMRTPSGEFAERADDVLGTGGEFGRMMPLLQRSGFAEYFEQYARLELLATEIRCYDATTVPGLLQTEEYMRCIIRAGRPDEEEDLSEEFIVGRMGRQVILDRPQRPRMSFVLDESALRRTFAPRSVMKSQMARLIDLGGRPRICLQVLPLDCGPCVAVDGSGGILTFEEGPDFAYVEGLAGGHAFIDPVAVAKCSRRFEHLKAAALSPRQSTELIRELMEAL
ncbi:helix-turn-helix domain-containing protein [Yinghuangia sp. YIM S09857]|uniref:helix-turn-helix domain-containing protein n=1 Tax=Yinghuangia sp. YIM S09857 TaxID=3436929 RepID=UPI003F538198